LDELAHQWHCCAGQPTGWEEDDRRTEYHRHEARKAHNDVGKLLLPWYKRWQKEDKTPLDLWREFKAREKDPEYAKFLRAERARLREISRAARAESEAMADIYKAKALERERLDALTRKRKHARLRR
jgi:hypothetical protein